MTNEEIEAAKTRLMDLLNDMENEVSCVTQEAEDDILALCAAARGDSLVGLPHESPGDGDEYCNECGLGMSYWRYLPVCPATYGESVTA